MIWEYKVSIACVIISILCKIGAVVLKSQEKAESVPMNRAQRRHSNGKVPVQKFRIVNYKGRQRQGKGRAVRGW